MDSPLNSLLFWQAAGAEHAADLPLSMLLIFGSAKLFSEVFERLHQPGIVGEILAGILIGPSVLGWINPEGAILAFAELGVIFLLFRVGLEVKPSEFLNVGSTAALVAISGVVVPFGLGWLLAWAWGYSSIESIFLGSSMVATSVGITAQVLAAKGYLRARASRIILAAAVIDDVLGLIVLAIASSIASGEVNVLQIALTAILAIGFTLLTARWGSRAVGALIPRIRDRLSIAEAQFALAMCLLFFLSFLAEFAGVAAIIGAFLAGMSLSDSVGHRVHDLTSGVSELFVPFFLVGIGLRFDLSAFSDVSTVLFAGVIVLAALVSKFAGCGLAALSGGRADAIRIGVGMIPRGEVGMVVAQIGLAMAVISRPIFGVVVFMSVMTTLAAPPLLKWAYRGVEADEQSERLRIG